MRYFSILFCFLGACLALLFLYRTTVAEKIISDRLLAMGAEEVHLSVSELSSKRFRIFSLYATFTGDSHLESLNVEDLALSYTLPELFKGELAELIIEKLEIKGAKQSPEAGEGSTRKNSPPFLPQKISVQHLNLSLPGRIEELSLQLSSTLDKTKDELELHLRGNGSGLRVPGLQIAAAEGDLFLQTDLQGFIHFQEKSRLTVEEFQGASLQLSKAHLQLSGRLHKQDSAWQSDTMRFFLASQGLFLGGRELQLSPLSIQLARGSRPDNFQAHLHADELRLQHKGEDISLKDIKLDLARERDKLQSELLFSPPLLSTSIGGSFTHDLTLGNGEGEFHISQPLELVEIEPQLLSQLIVQKPSEIGFSEGQVQCRTKLQWEKSGLVSVDMELEVEDGAGNYKETSFNGLNLRQDVRLFPVVRSLSQGSLHLSELTSGVTLSGIELRNRFLPGQSGKGKLPTIHVDSLQADLLGASMSSSDFSVDLAEKSLDLPLHLHGIDLTKLISLKKIDGLSATGVVDGTIHLEYRDQQFSIRDGELLSRAPGGTISYLPPGGPDSLSQLPPVAVKALEEFRYVTLKATPRYSPDGTLTFSIRMEGTSPPLNTSRPVHLNLNVEQNLLSLLKSLRYSKNLTDELEQGLQGGKQKK